MNGYVVGGYLVVLISLGSYALFVVQRLRTSRRRLEAALPATTEESAAVDDRST